MTISHIAALWDRLWFEPTSPAVVCFFRIFFGFLALLSCLLLAPDLMIWFGPHALISTKAIQHLYDAAPTMSLLFVRPHTTEFVWLIYCVMTAAALLVTLGLFTRLSLIILFIGLVSFHAANPLLLSGGDTLIRVITFLLIFSPCDRLFSLDSWWQARKYPGADPWQYVCSPWVQRLLQLEMAMVYFQSFWSKMAGETWCNGTAVYYVARLTDLQRLPVPYLFDHVWTCQLLTWGTMALECSLWTLVFVKELRYWVLLAGIIFHLSIDWSMNIPIFEYVMIAMFINFIDAADLRRFLDWCRGRIARFSVFPL